MGRVWQAAARLWPAVSTFVVPTLAAATLAVALVPSASLRAQPPQFFGLPNVPVELSESVHLDEINAATKTHLEQVRALVANEQWDEAIETLRRVMENHGGKVAAVGDRRYISVRDYCHLQISRLPAVALATYRRHVDPQAEKWYEEGIARHDAAPLVDIVEQLFCSSWGDDALFALGEMALGEGDYNAARGYWDKLIETPPREIPAADFKRVRDAQGLAIDDAELLDRWYRPYQRSDNLIYELAITEPPKKVSQALARVLRVSGVSNDRLVYPASDIPLADVCARQLLVRILEQPSTRVREKLTEFTQEFPEARGRLGGREVNYAEAIGTLIESSQSWPKPKPTYDWPTFAGSPDRNQAAAGKIDFTKPKWTRHLNRLEPPNPGSFNDREPLSYFPVVVGELLLVATQNEILAFDLRTGQPKWSKDGVIYPTGSPQPGEAERLFPTMRQSSSGQALGTPRYTLTVFNNKVYARIGNPVTSSPNEQHFPRNPGYLVCLDLAREGSVVWDSQTSCPLDEKWAFEGTPVCDGPNVYVGMRKSDVWPQAHVACLDAQTGRLRWRRMVCSAGTPANNAMDEITHNLLTLHGDRLYYNTGLGAVASLSTRDGQVLWAYLYRRAKGSDVNHHKPRIERDLSPCVYDRGMIFAAPSDSEVLLGLDATTGVFKWEAAPLDGDTPGHLIGVAGDKLVACGKKLWFINVDTGKLVLSDGVQAVTAPRGRGLVAGNQVLWPTNRDLIVLDAEQGRASRDEINFEAHGVARGGNLVVASGYLFVITSAEIYAFELDRKPLAPREEANRRPLAPGEGSSRGA
jgi:outer membrane protein assembly factor BamB